MKTVGIIAAMNEELMSLRSRMEIDHVDNKIQTDFYIGKLFEHNAVIVRSGIGKVNAAACAQSLIDLYKPDYIINIGSAGGISDEISVGEIVIAEDLIQHDFDTTAFGTALGVIPRMEESCFKSGSGILDIAQAFSNANPETNIRFGRIASGDKFVATFEDKSMIRQMFKAICVEMEGAAIAQVCYMNHIPFAIIRGITDNADDNATGYYVKFLQKAVENTLDLVKYIIQNY